MSVSEHAISEEPVSGAFVGRQPFLKIEGLINGFWTDLTRDVLIEPGVRIEYGISGAGPLDLVASSGRLTFSLNNSTSNSAGVLGYYSLQHSARRSGFQLGISLRASMRVDPYDPPWFRKFEGRLVSAEAIPGVQGMRRTSCRAVDWMNEAANTRINLATQINKRSDEVLSAVVAAVSRQPASLSFDVGATTFPYSLDNSQNGSALSEIQKVCQSEYGRCYIRGGMYQGGILRFEKRTARLTPLPIAIFDGTMQDLSQSEDVSRIKNRVVATAHPRRVDAVDTTVLFAKPNQNNPAVAPSTPIKVTGRYTDPSNPSARVGGTNMRVPVATTDYLMNSAADGSGADLTAAFAVVATYSANQVEYLITNNGGSTGYVTKLQARGRGLYDYDPLDSVGVNQDSIDDIGESLVTVDMPYQSDVSATTAVAEYIVTAWSAPGSQDAEITLIPRNDAEHLLAMSIEPGDALSIMEEVTGVNSVFYVQAVSIRIKESDPRVMVASYQFILQRALVQDYWQLGTAGYSELGVNTVLAPL